jgi:hypothetical protein
MPRGPKGEKRPADVIGAAVMIGKIATGEIDDLPRMTARTPPPWRWGAWAERRELKVCLQRGGKRSRGKRRSSVGQNSSQSLSDTLWDMEDIVALIDARDERAKKIDAENAIA